MYIYETSQLKTPQQKQDFKNDPMKQMFLPASFLQQADVADEYVCHATNFKDPCPDCTIHNLKHEGKTIASHTVDGF